MMYTYTFNGRGFTNHTGNNWDDYAGFDSIGDGIGDSIYVSGQVTDNYPLLHWPAREAPLRGNDTAVTPAPASTATPSATPAPGTAFLLIGLAVVAGAMVNLSRRKK